MSYKPSDLATTLTFHPEFDDPIDLARWIDDKLTAALPHLAPKPTGSDEESAQEIVSWHHDSAPLLVKDIHRRLAAVRAEERAAQADNLAKMREAGERAIAAQATQIAALREKVSILEAEIRVMRKLPSAIDAALEMSGGVVSQGTVATHP